MFTVLHRADGVERIHQAVEVTYYGQSASTGAGVAPSVALSYANPDNLPLSVTHGDVFVMNEQGATVAKYILGPGLKQGSSGQAGEARADLGRFAG